MGTQGCGISSAYIYTPITPITPIAFQRGDFLYVLPHPFWEDLRRFIGLGGSQKAPPTWC